MTVNVKFIVQIHSKQEKNVFIGLQQQTPWWPNLTAANLVVIAITVLLSLLSMATLAA